MMVNVFVAPMKSAAADFRTVVTGASVNTTPVVIMSDQVDHPNSTLLLDRVKQTGMIVCVELAQDSVRVRRIIQVVPPSTIEQQ